MSVDPVSLAITAALTAGSMALQASRKIEGPRLDDLSVTLADYGTPLNYFYGVRRFEGCPIFWAEPLKEVKRKRKTKGGKYNEYTYYGTWATAIAGHEIDGVTRVWFDKQLAYDATGPGPMSIGELFAEVVTSSKGKSSTTRIASFSQHCRFYLGSETQEPDPRMLATVEAEHGAGSCPAYRGIAWMMIEEAPLEKVGNRIPQVMVEAVSTKAAAYPYESFPAGYATPNRLWGFTYSPDRSRVIWTGGSKYEIWDVAARSLMICADWPTGYNLQSVYGFSNSGAVYFLADGYVQALARDGSPSATPIFATTSVQTHVRLLQDGMGREHLITMPIGYWFDVFTLDTVGGASELYTGDLGGSELWELRGCCTDSHGDIWLAGCPGGTTGKLMLYRLAHTSGRGGPDFFEIATGHTTFEPGTDIAHYDGHFIVHWAGSRLLKIDEETGAIVADVAQGADTYNNYKQWANLLPGSSAIWLNDTEISLSDLSVIRTIDITDWKIENADGMIYDPVNHALFCAPQLSTVVTWRYLDRIIGNSVTLQSVAEDVAQRCRVAVGDYSFGTLDQEIKGYSWTQGSGRDILEPLFDAHDTDIRPHDFVVQGVKRGGASGGTIDVADFVRDGDMRYVVSIKQDSDLPRAMTFSFADIDADQQTNSVVVQRPLDAVDGVRELTINMTTMAESAASARQLAERYFRRKWVGRTEINLKLTMQQIALEPADLRTLSLDGNDQPSRLTRMTVSSDGSLTMQWEVDYPSIASLTGNPGADMDGRREQAIPIPGLTKGVVLDVPLAVDAHDSTTPFIYYGAAPFSDDVFWAGADFQQADNDVADEYDPAWAAVSAQDAMDWGYAPDALGVALTTVIDYGSTLTVIMKSGTLASSTEDDVLANATVNLALLGADGRWEYLQFITATLVDTNTYELSGLLRGRRGTEQHVGSHDTGDTFILVGPASTRRSLGAGEIGDTDYYRAVSQGRASSSGAIQDLTFTAAANRPYSPVHGVLTRNAGTGDWTIDAVRRTRIGGFNVDGQNVPLGETSEAWEADIMDGTDIVRTITGTSLPLTYTAAMQTEDWGGTQSSLSANLHQMSPSLALRGFPLALAA